MSRREDLPKEQFDRETSTYLWDGSGEPDGEVARLERALAQFRHSGNLPIFPADAGTKQNVLERFVRIFWVPRLVATAVIALAVVLGAVQLFLPAAPRLAGGGWDVACLEGSLRLGSRQIEASGAKGKLEIGQALVTNQNSRATVTVAEIGELEVEPGSRVRLVQSSRDHKRIALDHGTIHAAIWAPPGEFVVDTPSAVVVDLGCAYTLQVSDDGSGTLRTTLGWVGFHLNGRDSFIPAGAMCPTRRGIGPGTPYFEDAPQPIREALAVFDFGTAADQSRDQALRTVLTNARKQDGLTLWHLLSRTEGEQRVEVYDRFRALIPPPSGVTCDGILRLDQPMLDLWWNALALGDISIWRYWEQAPGSLPIPNQQMLQKKAQMLSKKTG